MTVPNWQHHSRKDKKRTLKPQAIRSRRDARAALLARLYNRPGGPRTNASDHSTGADNKEGRDIIAPALLVCEHICR